MSTMSRISPIGQSERLTQKRVVDLFCEALGYRYLGYWKDRAENSNIEDGLLTAYLSRHGYSQAQITRALHELHTEASNPNRSLYQNNRKIYSLLRYGVPVKVAAGENTELV